MYLSYQKILFTHNLQFYNLILDWIQNNKENEKWNLLNIYNRQDESIIYENSANYIKIAKTHLEKDELQSCGNVIRKEFERLIHKFAKINSIGKKEETNVILELILNDNPIYINQNEKIQEIQKLLAYVRNIPTDMSGYNKLISNQLKRATLEYHTPSKHIKSILKELTFYRKILLNKSSHDNPDIECYRKEYQKSIEIIEELSQRIDSI